MHELALCQAVAETVRANTPADRDVRLVALRIGHLRQVVPDTFRFCWQATVDGTDLAGCEIEIEHVPAVVRCSTCGAETTLDAPILLCGACDGADVAVVAGEDFLVVGIDVLERT